MPALASAECSTYRLLLDARARDRRVAGKWLLAHGVSCVFARAPITRGGCVVPGSLRTREPVSLPRCGTAVAVGACRQGARRAPTGARSSMSTNVVDGMALASQVVRQTARQQRRSAEK